VCRTVGQMTNKRSDIRERISPEDMALAKRALDWYMIMFNCRTYAFNITSDTSHEGRNPYE